MGAHAEGLSAETPVIRIEPRRGRAELRLKELWGYRELLYFLVWRDLKVRYKQTLLGAAWAVIQPLMTALVFSVFFGRLAKMPSDGVPYPLFSLAALVPWMFFANALTQSSNSLVGSANLITKVYFPRLLIPIGAVLSGLVDFVLSFTVLLCTMAYYHVYPTSRILYAPVFVVLALVTAMGIGLWLSALNVKYRDVRHTVPFLVQFWMFATPVAYPSSLLREPWHSVYGINPMAGAVEGLRWSLLGTHSVAGAMLILSGIAAMLLFAGGLYYFRSVEKSLADFV